MSKGINKVILVGNVGSTPDLRSFDNGTAVANFSIATSDSWKDKTTGEKVEYTEWHRIVLKGRLAEVAGEYLDKGCKVYLEGQLRTRKWTDKQNVDHYTTEIHCSEMQILTFKNESDSSANQSNVTNNQRSQAQSQSQPAQRNANANQGSTNQNAGNRNQSNVRPMNQKSSPQAQQPQGAFDYPFDGMEKDDIPF